MSSNMSFLNDKEYYDIVKDEFDHIKLEKYSNIILYPKNSNYVIKRCKSFTFCQLRELELLRNIDHPNIVKIHGYYKVSEDTFDIILEKGYCDISKIRFTDIQLKALIYHILKGLSYIHSKNIIHRDIKPANILLFRYRSSEVKENNFEYVPSDNKDEKLVIKICDFDNAKYNITYNREKVWKTCLIQTITCRAPEITYKDFYDCSIDTWSLGTVILHLLRNRTYVNCISTLLSDWDRNEDIKNKDENFLKSFYSKILYEMPEELRTEPCMIDRMIKCKTDNEIFKMALDMLVWESKKRLPAKCLLFKYYGDITQINVPRNISYYYERDFFYNMFIYNNTIDYRKRYILYNWLWSVSNDYRLEISTLIVSFILSDIYLCCNINVDIKEYKLFLISSLLLSNKFNDIQSYYFNEKIIVKYLNNTITMKDMYDKQLYIIENYEFFSINSIVMEHLHNMNKDNLCILSYIFSRNITSAFDLKYYIILLNCISKNNGQYVHDSIFTEVDKLKKGDGKLRNKSISILSKYI